MLHTLVIAASANGEAGRSTRLALDFLDALPVCADEVQIRVLSDAPPPPVNQDFLAGAFSPPDRRSPEMQRALAYSDGEIAALKHARRLVIATPMYNFGMPGLLKSWFDQIVRPHETFEMTGDPDSPYRGLLSLEQCIVITTRGSFAFSPTGSAREWNLLDRHLTAILGLVGIDAIEFVDCPGLDEDASSSTANLAAARTQLDALVR